MNWIKQNTFLSGFIGFMVVAAGALGFLLFKEHGRYDQARTDYESKVSELNRLETLKPYPESENLKKIEAQKTEHVAAIEALRKNVSTAQIPVEPLTREQFQDKLREAATRITAKAKEANVALPAMFYLGMEKYQTEPPLPEAAPALGRQLKALEFVVTKMIEDGVAAITKFDRDALPEEEGKSKEKEKKEVPAKGGGKGDKSSASGKNLVSYHGVQIEFLADQSRFRAFLNNLVSEKSQFYVPRQVVVKNEKDAAPPRTPAPDAAAAAASAGTPVPGSIPPEPTTAKYTFGAERVVVSLLLEVVDFAEVAAK